MADEPDPEDLLRNFGDLFGQLFRDGAPATRDLRVELRVSLTDAVEGSQHQLTLARTANCRGCKGLRGAPGASHSPCARCGGAGGEELRQGDFLFKRPCAECQGAGGTWTALCPACGGKGGETNVDHVKVSVPAGVAEGQALRLAGKGNDLGNGEGPGDALVVVRIEPDPRFRREGDDLHVRAALDRMLARKGGRVSVELPSGERRVPVDAGQKSGDRRVMRGWGAVKLGSPPAPVPSGPDEPYRSIDSSAHRGDLVVTFVVDGEPLPEAMLDARERDAREDARSDQRFRVGLVGAGIFVAAIMLYAALAR